MEVRSRGIQAMETELKNAMFARTRDAYAFKVLDPAVVRDPKDRDSPNKPLIICLGLSLASWSACIWARSRQRRASVALA